MSLEPNLESSKLLDASCPNDRLVGGNSTSPLRTEEDDDDDDIDFNPFQKESLSSESSSSLRSEVEGLDADVVDSNAGNPIARETGSSFKLSADHPLGNSEEREKETVMQAENKACDGMPEETVSKKRKRREGVLIPEPGSGTLQEKDNATSSGTDIVDDVTGEQTVANPPRNPILDLDNDDAICKRTRARYSLANFTLDELENFLQETDDDDDLPNIDEEEEYRKFLAAVLQGGDGDDAATFEGNDDDDDDANDEDFDIEIEEAVASDVDDCMVPNQEHIERPSRGPQTRQSKLQKVDGRSKKKETGLGKGPLRPLFPILPRAPIGPSSETRYLTLERACLPSTAQQCLLNGFMPHQIGQLYSLIHEHVQLLVQVYSLCVLEPSRQHIASQMQGLLSELLHRRDQVLAWRNVPYPSLCFHLSYLSGSVSHENLICSPANIDGSSQTNDVQDSHWLPLIDGPVLSLLDVAPLKLVGRYMDDVSAAVREHWRRLVGSSNTYFEKDSLFPSPTSPSAGLVNSDISRGAASVPPESDVSHASSRNHKPPRKTFAATLVESTKKQSVALVPEQIAELPSPTSPSAGLVNSDISRGAASVPPESDMSPASSQNHKPPRKTLAATLVESTKKQSVALVPEQIAELAQSFYSLFNPALFPHKPPPLPVANRVLFTDSEDELLALGMMEYNTDWKAIQQRFLPCKSKHQIFVRQKNQCSSKAPENPIKAVRKMKTSPLTPEEKARIHQALKLFKLDWMSIWKFVVPYRDPSLLPRQWRIAIGTQKSYKMDAAKREKRRLYEANRRRNKAVAMRSSQMMSEKEDNQTRNAGGQNDNGEDEDRADNDNEAYVHEAFLADWRPPSTGDVSIDTIRQQQNNHANPESQSENGSIVPRETNPPTYHYRFYQSYSASPSCHPSESTSKPFINEPFMRPYRARGASSSQLVRLAPDLPPVNLPPSARIISQATFMVAAGHPPNTVGGSSHVVMMQQTVEKLNANISTTHAVDIRSNTEEKESDSDLRMHPLLFQNPRSGRLPYYPLGNYSRIPTSFSFFPVSQSRINLAHFHNRHPALLAIPGSHRSLTAEEIDPMSSSLDFHPLLQRIEQLSTDLELSREGFSQPQITDSTTVAAAAAAAEVASRDSLSSPVGDGNELDLDIHLNSSSRKKMVLSKAVAGSNKEARFVTVADSVEGTNEVTHASGRYSGDTGAGGSTDKVDSCNPTVSLQSYDNEPPPGIVMEQEELSDSDEEIEHVEFECEEMEDSEGEEGSDAEHITNNRNKEQGDGTIGTSSHDQRNAPDTCGTSKGIGARKTRGSSLVSSNSPCDVADSSNAKVTATSTTAPLSPNRYRKKNKLRSKSVT